MAETRRSVPRGGGPAGGAPARCPRGQPPAPRRYRRIPPTARRDTRGPSLWKPVCASAPPNVPMPPRVDNRTNTRRTSSHDSHKSNSHKSHNSHKSIATTGAGCYASSRLNKSEKHHEQIPYSKIECDGCHPECLDPPTRVLD